MKLLLDVFDWTAYLTGVIGAPLGWIEYFHPNVADNIEKSIDQGQSKLEKWGDKVTGHHLYDILLTFSILLFFFIIYIPIGHYNSFVPAVNLAWYYWVLIVIFYSPIMLSIGAYFLAWLIDVCNNATGGHALGTIGLALIVLGIFCDTADKAIEIIPSLLERINNLELSAFL